MDQVWVLYVMEEVWVLYVMEEVWVEVLDTRLIKR